MRIYFSPFHSTQDILLTCWVIKHKYFDWQDCALSEIIRSPKFLNYKIYGTQYKVDMKKSKAIVTWLRQEQFSFEYCKTKTKVIIIDCSVQLLRMQSNLLSNQKLKY